MKSRRGLIVISCLIIVGLVVASFGLRGLSSSLMTSGTKSETISGGMLIGWSTSTAIENHTTVASISTPWVQMTIDAVRKNARLEVDFWSRFSQSHTLAMILPFQVGRVVLLQNESVGVTISSAISRNLSESSSVVGCVWADLHNYSNWESGSVVILASITGNIVASQSGEDEIYLPIGIYPPIDVIQSAESYVPAGTTFPSPNSSFAINFTKISLVVPADAKVEQLIPSYADVEQTTTGLIVNLLPSGLFGSSSVTMNYQDVGVANAYQNGLFSGGLLTASGSILILVGAGFAIRTRRRGMENPELLLSESSRRLASVMFMDIVGYSAIAHADESIAFRLLRDQRELVRPFFQRHNGREIKTIGDGVLVEFASALDAVTCAFEIQKAIHDSNTSKATQDRILMRIGIHLGDVIHTRNDVFGDAVNLASRVEPAAPAGGVAFTRQVYEEVKNKVKFPIFELGPHKLKNIGEGYELFRIVFPWEEGESVDSPQA
jgi:class 3 adenylate cyclase